ncbi:MAG TPA: DUF3995 domain-containing protein [Thermoleophilaceae bacterium]|nr:DUF3995 domain-containing protein [Thermoleophilaceae bacterium]
MTADAGSIAARASSAGLLAIAGLHALWATGSPWPLRDSRELADKVAGRPGDFHSPAECLAVSGLLVTASALVAGAPRGSPRLSRIGAAGVIAVLTTRGALGLAGRTDVLAPGASSERFRRIDRRVYSPLCLALAAGALPALRRRDSGFRRR